MFWKTTFRLSVLCALLLAACGPAASPTESPKVIATNTPAAAAPTAIPTVAPTAAPAQPSPTVTVPALPTPLPPTAESPTSTPPLPTQTTAPEPAPTTPAPATTALPHLAAGQPISITALHMLDANTGWAIAQSATDPNSHIVRTADGANTWQDVTPPEPQIVPDPNLGTRQTAAAFFFGAQEAWVAYGYEAGAPIPASPNLVVWHTRDGGQSWTPSAPLNMAALEGYGPSDVFFVDESAGWLMAHVGAGMNHDYVVLFATGDGGANWQQVVDPMALPETGALSMSCYKSGLVFLNPQTGWVTGNCYGVVPGSPYFYQTADGGHTWNFVTLPPPAEAPNLFTQDLSACGAEVPVFASATEGWLPMSCSLLDTNQKHGWLYATVDGGQTWTPLPLPLAYGTLNFINPTTGWWLGTDNPNEPTAERQLYRTQDGGQTWTLVKKLGWGGPLNFIDAQAGWAVATNGPDTVLVKTSDGGQRWSLLAPQIAP